MSSVWGDESFQDENTSLGPHPNLYGGIVPWTTNAESATGYVLQADRGELYDGYQAAAGEVSGRAAFADDATATASDFCAWSIARLPYIDEAEVFAVPQVVGSGPDLQGDAFYQFGVCACVNGGTAVQAGGDAARTFLEDVDGYFLIEAKTPTTIHRLFLIRVDLGALTLLASQDVSEIDAAHVGATGDDFFGPRPLRLRIEDGVGVEKLLTAHRIDTAGVEQLAFNGAISDATGLGRGRWGFGGNSVLSTGLGSLPLVLIDTFEVRALDGATPIFVDDFSRLQRLAGRYVSDTFKHGRSLSSAWVGDGKSREDASGPQSLKTLRFPLSVDSIRVESGFNNADAITWNGYHLRQIPEVSPDQRYGLTVTRATGQDSIRTEMGILLRCQAMSFATAGNSVDCRSRRPSDLQRLDYYKVGYLVSIIFASSAFTLEVRHYEFGSSADHESTLIATANLSSFGLVQGTPVDLDAEIRNYDGNELGSGTAVSIKVKVGGSVVTPVPSSVPGVTESDDLLIDTRSVATQGAGGAGFYLNSDTEGASALFTVDTWEARALTVSPTVDPDDQPSISIPSEVDGKSGTLSIPMNSRVDVEILDGPKIFDFESGAMGTLARTSRDRRAWRVSAIMTKAQKDELSSLHSSNGIDTPFDWTVPFTGEPVAGFFAKESLDLDWRSIQIEGESFFRVDLRIIEAFVRRTYNP